MDSFYKELLYLVEKNSKIDESFYEKYNVKRGLRNKNGTGVLVGVTNICDVDGYDVIDNKKVPKDGNLFLRGYKLTDIVQGFQKEDRFGYEELSYLLLFGELPSRENLSKYNKILDERRIFPKNFKEDVFLKMPSKNIMNKLQRSILAMFSYDDNPESLSLEKNLSLSLDLIAKMPLMLSYAYSATNHYFNNESLIIHEPLKNVSTAENFLHLIRKNSSYTKLEAQILDLLLVAHAEHGGGNNSAFTTHVLSSSGADIYSVISAAIGSLNGSRHGGANKKVCLMVEDIKKNIDFNDEEELEKYLFKILNKEAFDKTGLIYGMGHAIYTKSDPRTVIIKEKCKELAKVKNRESDFNLISNIEKLSKKIFKKIKGEDFEIAANIDLYSGFVYDMLGISKELFTPLFALARCSGLCAHRLEQLRDGKIIRPAYVNTNSKKEYIDMKNR